MISRNYLIDFIQTLKNYDVIEITSKNDNVTGLFQVIEKSNGDRVLFYYTDKNNWTFNYPLELHLGTDSRIISTKIVRKNYKNHIFKMTLLCILFKYKLYIKTLQII